MDRHRSDEGRGDALIAFWNRGRAPAGLPDRTWFDPLNLLPWIGHLSVYEAVDGCADFRNRLEGTRVMLLTGENWQGRLASEVDSRFNVTFLANLKSVAESRSPMRDQCVVFQKRFLYVDRILLPVTLAGQEVDQIFLGMFPIPTT